MVRMLVYYVLAIALMVGGFGVIAVDVAGRLLGGTLDPVLLLAGGLGPMILGRVLLARGRTVRHRLEAGHREQLVLDEARRRGGALDAGHVARRLDLPQAEAQRLLEGMARKGSADMQVSDEGATYFKFDEQRLLKP